MAQFKFKHNQDLLYKDMHFLYHSSTRDESIIQMNVPSPERRKMLARHNNFYVCISNTVYFKVLTEHLVPLNINTNRAAVYLLTQEED